MDDLISRQVTIDKAITIPIAKIVTEDKVIYRKAVFVEDIEALPSAERHGEWVFKFYCGNMSGYDYGMNCSVCGKPTHRQFAEKMPPYCQNCGAKMDEVSE